MSRSDFEARLNRLTKPPEIGAERAAHKALLDQQIGEMRRVRAREAEEHEAERNVDWISTVGSVLLLLGSVALGALFKTDPDEAMRKAVVMVPLMALVAAFLSFRIFRRSKRDYLLEELEFDLDFFHQLGRFFR